MKKNFKRQLFSILKIFVLICFVLLPCSAFGTEKTDSSKEGIDNNQNNFEIEEPERKDPFMAGLLSCSWSGLGQFYTQEYTLGSFFLLTDLVQKGLLIYSIIYYSDKYATGDDDIAKWQDLERKDKGLIIGLVVSMLFVRVLCVLNAVESAEKYNRNIFFPYWKNQNRLRFTLYTRGDEINLGIIKPLNF